MGTEFSCGSCGKSYKWKPEFAGRKVKCKCGSVMTAPQAPPQPKEDEPDFDALYSLAEDGKQAAAAAPAAIRCPSCQADLEPGSSLCAECGFNLKTGKRAKAPSASSAGASAAFPAGAVPAGAGAGAAAASPMGAFAAFGSPRRGLQQDAPIDNKVADLYAPIGLILVGIVLSVLRHVKFDHVIFPVPQAVGMAVVEMLVSMALLAVFCLFMMRIAEIAFGAPGPAALKLAAIAIAPAALASIVSYMVNDFWGMIGFSIAFGIIWILYHYLFDLDQSEIWLLGGLTTVITMFAVGFIAVGLLRGMPGFEALASGGKTNEDKVVEEMEDFGHLKPAMAWLKESGNRIIGDQTREQSLQIVEALEAAGATEVKVRAAKGQGQATTVVATLPRAKDKRKAIFDAEAKLATELGRTAQVDTGQTYLLMNFSTF